MRETHDERRAEDEAPVDGSSRLIERSDDFPETSRESEDLLEAGRYEPVTTYDLDQPSHAVARECGRRLAERAPLGEWEKTTIERREQITRQFQRDLASRLGTEVHEVEFDDLRLGYGSFNPATGRLEINDDLLRRDDPRELFMTLAHEQRHVWQQDVIQGEMVHPGGPDAQQRLRDGAVSYAEDAQDAFAYPWNELERDGETFAYATVSEYLKQQKRTS